MKQIKRTLLLLLIIVNIACKDRAEQKAVQESTENIQTPKQLTINFSFKTNKADVFKIMMNNIQVDELQKKNVHIFENVVPSSKKDRIIAKFEEGAMSRNILIHLGNEEVKEVEVISVELTYGNNHIHISTAEDFDKYFAVNKFIEKEPVSKKLKTIKRNGQHNPVIYVKSKFLNRLFGTTEG